MTDPAAASTTPAHLALRAATADKHAEVDAIFAHYDLADAGSYASLLIAHARVLPPIEQVLALRPALPPVAPRAELLKSDLAALERPMPASDDIAVPPSDASAWGMLYVIEGSRLGGAFLARTVPETLPKAYLSAAHARGGWRMLLDALDAAADGKGKPWVDEAVAAARATFDLYAKATTSADQGVKRDAFSRFWGRRRRPVA